MSAIQRADIPATNGAGALADTVIANGYCVGCGACAALEESPFTMAFNDQGQYQPAAKSQADATGPDRVFATTTASVQEVCPFSPTSASEDDIGRNLFGDSCDHNSSVGYYRSSYAGHVTESDFRERGSSGGFSNWVLHELLGQNKVDYIINVQPRDSQAQDDEKKDGSPLFAYTIVSSLAELKQGSKSRYYPIELSDVIRKVRSQPGRYAIVGLPCFIRSVRLLQRQEPILAERIEYCIGLVCGHLKSRRYAESLAWQMGIPPAELRTVDFRIKNPDAPASRYSTLAASEAEQKVVPTKNLFGTDWGAGSFKYKACDFCDDVFAETADVVLGDAWLPQYVQDSAGTNIVVVRSERIHELIANARAEQRLELEELPIEQAVISQDAGLRHRRGALGYRLAVEQRKGDWVPVKRLPPDPGYGPRVERRKQDLRTRMRELSHSSFRQALDSGDLQIYLNTMAPLYRQYQRVGQGGPLQRIRRMIGRLVRSLKKRIPGFA
ncbi:Coenzyme F420 hydrogenase/dehydrogenase, beta subunit C-terminal domain [uncultured Marinobacter sp.]|uniref:Coenzyme F420 hydrogenase/dehydrogenase, beta subunit C-terminal domain n=1 Tax=uncultured Marinobacter sp. TaxID=187379 RepID=UPI0030DB330E